MSPAWNFNRKSVRRSDQPPATVFRVFAFTSAAAVLLVSILGGCRKNAAHENEAETEAEAQTDAEIRQLNEIPIEQLRVVLKGFPGDWRKDSDHSRGIEAPPTERAIADGARLIELVKPEDFSVGDMALRTAIDERRSLREFSDIPLTLDELSFLLWSTQGVTGELRDGDTREPVQQLRAAPSAGGRYPLETWLAIRNVAGIAPGIYRYLPSQHRLLNVHEEAAIGELITSACYGQTFVGEAAVVFVWAAVPYRTEWKYTYLSHRMIAIEAGHVCQNLYLAAQTIDAGACALLSYDQAQLDALIGVDGSTEFTVYIACLGKAPQPGK